MTNYKIIAIMGEAGSGKDTLMKEVLKACPGLHEIVSCTTRPPREGEVHGTKNRYTQDPDHWLRSHRDRPGV